MRTLLKSTVLLVVNAPVLLAQDEQAGPGLVSIRVNLMFWTLAIFILLYIILRRYAFPKIFGAVEAREKALQDAIDAAKRDREESEKLLDEQRRQIEGARNE